MRNRANGCRRGLTAPVSAAAILALTAGSAAAQANCTAQIDALTQELAAAEATQQPAAGEQRPAVAEPQQQAVVEPQQPSEAPAGQRGVAPPQDEGSVRQQGMPQPPEMRSVRPPAGATMGQPGDMAGGGPAGGTGQPGAQAGATGPIGAPQAGADMPQRDEGTGAQERVAASAGQQPSVNHPLVLLMADGSVVDMRPPEERQEAEAPAQPDAEEAAEQAEAGEETEQAEVDGESSPQEATASETEAPAGARALLADARAALQIGDEEACLEAVEQARATMTQ